MRRSFKIAMLLGSIVSAATSGVISYVLCETKRKNDFKEDAKKIKI